MSEIHVREFKAVAWDFDGILADSVAVHNAARKLAYDRVAFTERKPELAQIAAKIHKKAHNHGSNPAAINAWILAKAGFIDSKKDTEHELVTKIVTSKKSFYHDRVASGLPQIPGSVELFRRFNVDRPGMQAIASTAGPQEVHPFLQKNRLDHYLPDRRLILAGHPDVKQLKPEPDVYEVAANALGVADPETLLVIEDSEQGIEAANRYGATVVAIATTRSLKRLHELTGIQKPDYIFEDFAEATAAFGYAPAE